MRAGDCTWAKALDKAVAANAWLVLDIKTEFNGTARAALHATSSREWAGRMIFQL